MVGADGSQVRQFKLIPHAVHELVVVLRTKFVKHVKHVLGFDEVQVEQLFPQGMQIGMLLVAGVTCM